MSQSHRPLLIEFNTQNGFTTVEKMPAYAVHLSDQGYRGEIQSLADRGWIAITAQIFKTIALRRPDCVLTNEYRRSFLVNLALRITRSKATHIVLGMNLSGKPIASQNKRLQSAIDWVFARSDRAVVHSTHEAELFASLHNLPREKFAFSHWGFDLPQSPSTRFSHRDTPYFCMIGRNNRDVETFAKAVKLAGQQGIAIIPEYLDASEEAASILEIHRDLSLDDCIDCLRNAACNVTLLNDDTRGAGHITVVTALHMGIPQIHTETKVLREYLPDSRFSIPVPIGDAEKVAAAMQTALSTASQQASDLRKSFAQTWLSHQQATARISTILDAALNNAPLPFITPKWGVWLKEASSPASMQK